jgi:acetoacetyl-CoA synthetase
MNRRADRTINHFSIRMGTSEIYRVVEESPKVRDSLVVDLEYLGCPSLMFLFVVLQHGHVIDDAIGERIYARIRTKPSASRSPTR